MRRSVENAVRPNPSGLNFAIALHILKGSQFGGACEPEPQLQRVEGRRSWKTALSRTIMEPMLNEIRTSEAAALEGPAAMLLDCHKRIRHFTGMAVRLADNPTAPAGEIRAAAEAIVRYFTIALPVHEADEDESIYTRLHHAVAAGNIVAKSVETMVSQHRAIDELLQSIIPLWQAVQSQPVELIELAPELKGLTNRLRLHLAAHLAMEEDVIFPALEKLLSAGERQEIEREMRTRRIKEST